MRRFVESQGHFLKKYFTKAVGLNLLLAAGIFFLLLLIVQLGLKSYTRHGEEIIIPDLKGKNILEAIKQIEAAGLEWTVLDSIYQTDEPPMSIVDLYPKPGSKVKSGRMIYFTLNTSSPPMVEVPDLVGRSSLKFADMQLRTFGFTVGQLIYRPDPHYQLLLGMEWKGRPIEKGQKIPKGASINLILGDGKAGGPIRVPYLLGLSLREVKEKLSAKNLTLGALICEGEIMDTASALIIRQEPAFGEGKIIRQGEAIDVFISGTLPEGLTIQPEWYNLPDSIAGPSAEETDEP